MTTGADLTAAALEAVLPGRPLRSYPALLRTGSVASEWAAAGAPDGSLVIADYQVSPRGRADRPWKVTPGRGLGFSLVMRPRLPAKREDWLYTVVLAALADVCGAGARIEWPDELRREGAMVAAVGVTARLGAQGVKWAVVDFLLPAAEPPRGELLAAILGAIEARQASAPSAVLADYDRSCATIGRRVRMRLLGGTGPRVEGRAVATLEDGALLLETAEGLRAPVRPQDVREVEEA